MNYPLVETYLREEIGLDASSLGPGLLARAVRRRMDAAELADERAYLEAVAADRALRQALIEELVVPETWFFRDREPFLLLGRLVARRRAAGRPLRVLSLPCATGEEAYAIAITLLQAGLAPAEFSVDAMDISEAALAAARRASYGRNSFRDGDRTPPADWFEKDAADAERWRPVARVRDCVRFRQGNLFAFTATETYDIVFCRNLLIYFDAEMQAEAVRRLLSVLRPDGVFFVGHAEAAVLLRAGLSPLPEPRCFAFTRQPVQQPAASNAPAAKRTEPLRRPAVPPAAPRPFADVVMTPAAATTASPEPADSLAEAAALADQGRLAEAARLARFHIDAHGPSAAAFYLVGVTHDAAGETALAESAYRKVLYLDPRHEEAIAHLALLLEKRGSPEAARLWQRARRPQSAARGGDA